MAFSYRTEKYKIQKSMQGYFVIEQVINFPTRSQSTNEIHRVYSESFGLVPSKSLIVSAWRMHWRIKQYVKDIQKTSGGKFDLKTTDFTKPFFRL
jgi:hypothetical protein